VAGQSAGYGGVVNVVTKQAQARRSAEVELQSGSNGRLGVGIDVGGAFTGDARWSGRLVAASDRERPDALGYLGPYQTYALASLAFRDPGMGTALKLSHEHNEQGLQNFWSVYYDPLTTRLGQQGKALRLGDNTNRSAQVLTQTTRAEWTKQLDDDWQLGLKWQHQTSDFQLTGGLLGFASAYPVLMGVTPDGVDRRHSNSQRIELRGAFDTGPLRHQLLTALDHTQGSVVRQQTQPNEVGLFSALTGQLLRPIASAGPRVTITDTSHRETGVLVMDHVSWGRWLAMVGVRHLSYRPVNHMDQTAKAYTATLPSVGLVFRASDTLNWYGNTAKAFRANTGLMEFATGQQVKPESARQWELGLKGQSSDALLNWNVAAYRITQKNRAVTDTAHTAGSHVYYLSADGVDSKGLETSLSGQWTDRLKVGATYAYSTVTTPAGQLPVPFARHIWGLNAAYDLQQPGAGPWVGFNVYGRSAAPNLDTRLNLDTVSPPVLQLDVSGGYRNAGWSVVLGIKNLANRRNYSLTSGPNGAGFLLQPRQVYVSLNVRV
jgi:iron complex outermembrane receptor protein